MKPTYADRILALAQRRPVRGVTRKEIVQAFDVPPSTASRALKKLQEQGSVYESWRSRKDSKVFYAW
jgi:DNA-binding IclR family transcriptional regulator